VLPIFHLENTAAAEVGASIDGQSVLTGGDPLAPMTLVHAHVARARTRPSTVACADRGPRRSPEVSRRTRSSSCNARTSTVRHGLALPAPVGGAAAEVALVVIRAAGTGRSGRRTRAGGCRRAALVVDSWSEFVPAGEQAAGLAFQYDAPGARAPQAVILAVPPDLATATWNVEQLLATWWRRPT
jgi:hypothetical protein